MDAKKPQGKSTPADNAKKEPRPAQTAETAVEKQPIHKQRALLILETRRARIQVERRETRENQWDWQASLHQCFNGWTSLVDHTRCFTVVAIRHATRDSKVRYMAAWCTYTGNSDADKGCAGAFSC